MFVTERNTHLPINEDKLGKTCLLVLDFKECILDFTWVKIFCELIQPSISYTKSMLLCLQAKLQSSLFLSHLYTQAWAHCSAPHTRTLPSLSHSSHSSEKYYHHYHYNHSSLSSSLTTSLHAALISCPCLLRSTDIFLVSVYNMFVEYHHFHNLKVLRLFIYVCWDYLSGRISSSRVLWWHPNRLQLLDSV